jgi:hypothetical protein
LQILGETSPLPATERTEPEVGAKFGTSAGEEEVVGKL